MIEIDVQPDEHWSYLTKELLTLATTTAVRGQSPVPGVKWLPLISRIIEDRLQEMARRYVRI